MAPSKDGDSKDEIKVTNRSEKRKKSEGASKTEKVEQPKEKQIKKEKDKEKEEVVPKVDIYSEILKLENEESETRSADTDLKMWHDTCAELRNNMKDIFELKIKSSSATDVADKRIQASLLFVTLKKLNRLEKLRLKKSRDATNLAKQNTDSFNLQLQNLLYEVLHLKKEVTKCVNYKSADDNITMIPTEDFFKEAPETVATPEIVNDPHAQKLARLQWELVKRKELEQEVDEREMERDKSELIIRTKEDKLRDLGPQLTKILEQSLPVQQYLEMPLTDTRDQLELARLLPSPLYVMYSQCSAYSQACDKLLEVRVVGDADEAKRFRELESKEKADEENTKDESQDADGEVVKERRSKGTKVASEMNSVKSHPLKVQLKVSDENDMCVTVICSWCITLEMVTAEVELNTGTTKCDSDLVKGDTILSHLTPGDSGDKSPNPSSSWKLSQLGITDSLTKLMPGKLFYFWCQRLAGLDFLERNQNPDNVVEAKPEVSQLYMETIINGIRKRLSTRLNLNKQVEKLSKLKIDVVSATSGGQLPSRAIAKFKSWQSLDWESYNQFDFTSHVVASELVHSDCFLYKITVTRDKATLTALLSISPSYPSIPPLWCLSLKIGENKETQESSEVIRDMEREMNINDTEVPMNSQLHKLLLLTDVVLEVSSSEGEQSENFMKSLAFLDNVKGRMRRLPFYFNSSQQMFQQR